MSLIDWFPLAGICILGAMSPGPSLAVVLRNTVAAGRTEGVKTALAHGAGVGIYAFAAAVGLAMVVINNPTTFLVIQWLGAVFLGYLGVKSLTGSTGLPESTQPESSTPVNGFRSGFFTAFLNPKLAVFFVALFSQFVSPHAGLGEKMLMALTAAVIDAIWYLFVALSVSHTHVLSFLRRKTDALNTVFGIILLMLAVRILFLS